MFDRILSLSLKNRYLVVMLVLLSAAIGGFFLQKLPIDAVPDITNKQVQITTLMPGLSPEDMEKQITFPVESALSGAPGVEATRSLTRNGFSQVTVVFNDATDIYFGRNQVTERLNEAKDKLPVGATPRLGAVSTGLGEIYMWAVAFKHAHGHGAVTNAGRPGWQPDGSYLTPEGDALRSEAQQLAYLRTVEDWVIRPQIKSLPGVAGIDAIGGYERQYLVQPDLSRLRAYGMAITALVESLQAANQSRGGGFIEPNGEGYLVRADGRLKSVADIAAVVIATRNGAPIRVSDVARVDIGEELRMGSASLNGREAVIGTALMRIGENSRTVSLAVDQRVQEIRHGLPTDIQLITVLNRSKLVDATISTVRKNLAEGAVLVIVVLFILLGHVRAALITAAVIPLTVLLMSIGMVKANISGNLMSLGALDFGLIVDGAVIIVENCLRRLTERQEALGRCLGLDERLAEVMQASREMVLPSIYGQAIIITVYLPILALEGVEGRMFHPMAATVITALIAAFLLSVTLVPALIAITFKGLITAHESAFMHRAQQWYGPWLDRALDNPAQIVMVALGCFALALLLFFQLGQEFMPTLDEKDIDAEGTRLVSTGIHQSTTMQLLVEKSILKFPEVSRVFSKVGTAELAGDPMPPNASDTFIILKPKSAWPDPHETKTHLIGRLDQVLAQLPGNHFEFSQPIQMRFNELLSGVRSDLAIKVYGDDFAEMQQSGTAIAAVLHKIPGASDIKVEQVDGQPLLDIHFDREALARFGLTLYEVQSTVTAAIGGQEAGQLITGDRRFNIVVRLPEEVRNDIERLKALPVPLPGQGGTRAFVSLGDLASVRITNGLNQIRRENGKRLVIVKANVRGRDIGSFVSEAQSRVAKQVSLPSGCWLGWGGQFENLQRAKSRLVLVVPACFVLIFLLLYSALGTARQAVLVFSAVPLGLTGGVLALWLRGMSFSITAAVGLIALSGVAVLNGLVMVSRINQLREAGADIETAIRDGALTRLRPVLMTALVASLGFLPMALSTGTGAEVQRPMATVVIGGLITSTLLTLVVLPALYRRFASSNRGGKYEQL